MIFSFFKLDVASLGCCALVVHDSAEIREYLFIYATERHWILLFSVFVEQMMTFETW